MSDAIRGNWFHVLATLRWFQKTIGELDDGVRFTCIHFLQVETICKWFAFKIRPFISHLTREFFVDPCRLPILVLKRLSRISAPRFSDFKHEFLKAPKKIKLSILRRTLVKMDILLQKWRYLPFDSNVKINHSTLLLFLNQISEGTPS